MKKTCDVFYSLSIPINLDFLGSFTPVYLFWRQKVFVSQRSRQSDSIVCKKFVKNLYPSLLGWIAFATEAYTVIKPEKTCMKTFVTEAGKAFSSMISAKLRKTDSKRNYFFFLMYGRNGLILVCGNLVN